MDQLMCKMEINHTLNSGINKTRAARTKAWRAVLMLSNPQPLS